MEEADAIKSIDIYDPEPQGCGSELSWLGIGFVLPAFSATFYRHVVSRRIAAAVFFFFVFTSALTLVATLGIARTMLSANDAIQEAFTTGSFPEIVIKNGVAQVNAPQPFYILNEERTVFVLDTTGSINRINRDFYDQGVLLTRTSIHILNNGEYQQMPLSDLQTLFESDPIIINAGSVGRAWSQFTAIIIIVGFLAMAFWHILLRFAVIAALCVLIWGVASLVKPGIQFGSVLTVAIYAIIPAVYGSYILDTSGVGIPGTQTVILLIMTGFGLIAGLSEGINDFFSRLRSLRSWRALIGVPMLLVFVLTSIGDVPNSARALWVITILTGIVFLVVNIWSYKEAQLVSPVPEPRDSDLQMDIEPGDGET